MLIQSNYLNANDRFIVVISSSLQFYKNAIPGSPIFRLTNRVFGNSFEFKGSEGNYSKISHPQEGLLFINNDHKDTKFIISPFRSTYIYAKTQESSKITKKALVVKKFKQNMSSETDIEYYDNPQLQNEPLGKISIFEVRFIFAEVDNAILVARTDRIVKSNSDAVIVGWIDREHVVKWDNRIGVEFNKSNFSIRKKCELGKAFLSERHLLSKKQKNDLDKLNEDDTEYQLPHYANRYPVIEKRNNGDYYKIAFIGNAYGEKGKIYNANYVSTEVNKIMQIIQNNEIQIALLIDATKGMRNHIDNVKEAIRSFFNQYIKNNEIRSQIAVAVYRDYPDGKKIYELKSKFTKDRNQLLNALNSIKVYSNQLDWGAGTYPEALFYGINQTLERLNWKDVSEGEKFILLLGDHGNHEQYDQYPQDRQFSSEKIGQQLKRKGITLHAIQVNITTDKKNQKYKCNQDFKKQVENIILNNQGFGKLKKIYDNTSDAILSGIHNSIKDFQYIHERLIDIRNAGHSKMNSAQQQQVYIKTDSGLGRMYRSVFDQKILDRYNIDKNVFDATQVCQICFIKSKNSCEQEQIAKKVLMTKKDLEALKVQMQTLSDAIKYYEAESEEEFDLVIYRVVKSLTGDKIKKNENITDFILKKIGIPIRTKFLNKSLEELKDEVMQSGVQRKDFRRYLEEQLILLEQVTRESILKQEGWDEADQTYIWNDTQTPILYFFSLEQPLPKRGKEKVNDNQKRYAWVPLKYLP
jgi:hypothetical protein